MLNKLLRVKPWLFMVFTLFISFFNRPIYVVPLFIIWLTLIIVWSINIGIRLYGFLPDQSILNIKRFKTLIIVATGLLLAISITVSVDQNIFIKHIETTDWGIYFLVIINLLIFYTIYFISRCIVVLRGKNESIFFYSIGLFYFFIGIWIIQPKIIEILNKHEENEI